MVNPRENVSLTFLIHVSGPCVCFLLLWCRPWLKETPGGKGLFGLKVRHRGKPEKELKQGRKLEVGAEAERMEEHGLLSMACSACFLMLPRVGTTHRELDLPMSRKCPLDLPRDQPDGDRFSINVLSFCMLPDGARLIKTQPAQAMSPVGLLS